MSFFACDNTLHIFGGANFGKGFIYDDYHVYHP